jgi:hypothetical protein
MVMKEEWPKIPNCTDKQLKTPMKVSFSSKWSDTEE